jgi:hypothetical protein
VLASRGPRHPVGWLLLAFALLVVVSGVANSYAKYALLVRPRSLPGAIDAAIYNSVGLLPIAACLSFILLLTPNGSLPSPRWRWWAWATGAAPLLAVVSGALLPFEQPYRSVTNPLAVPALEDLLLAVAAMTLIVTGLGIPVAAWSLLVRFRRAQGIERQQLRWVVVLAFGQLLGRDSSLVVAAATLAVAALFQPARRRVQGAVDRRFNRRRHDAAQRIAAFTGRLHQQVDLSTLTAEVLAVVDLTLQPTTLSLWLRPPIDASQDHAGQTRHGGADGGSPRQGPGRGRMTT